MKVHVVTFKVHPILFGYSPVYSNGPKLQTGRGSKVRLQTGRGSKVRPPNERRARLLSSHWCKTSEDLLVDLCCLVLSCVVLCCLVLSVSCVVLCCVVLSCVECFYIAVLHAVDFLRNSVLSAVCHHFLFQREAPPTTTARPAAAGRF